MANAPADSCALIMGKALNNVDARPSTPEALTAFVRVATQRWQHAVKACGATVN